MTSFREWSESSTWWRKTSRSARELSTQRRMHRAARPSLSVCDYPMMRTLDRRPSPSKSNLGDGHLATWRPSLAPATTHSTYRAHTIRARDTPSVVAGCGRRSTRSVMLHALRRPSCLRTSASSRGPGSVSLPTTKDPPGGASWWFQRTIHHGLALLTQNLHLTPNTQQAEQASFTREEIPRRASQFFLKINKRQSS
jgi:hypothetical protein